MHELATARYRKKLRMTEDSLYDQFQSIDIDSLLRELDAELDVFKNVRVESLQQGAGSGLPAATVTMESYTPEDIPISAKTREDVLGPYEDAIGHPEEGSILTAAEESTMTRNSDAKTDRQDVADIPSSNNSTDPVSPEFDDALRYVNKIKVSCSSSLYFLLLQVESPRCILL